MQQYQQSQTIEAINKLHPFPWREQRAGQFVRRVDANSNEVILFEITALATLASIHFSKSQPNDSNAKP